MTQQISIFVCVYNSTNVISTNTSVLGTIYISYDSQWRGFGKLVIILDSPEKLRVILTQSQTDRLEWKRNVLKPTTSCLSIMTTQTVKSHKPKYGIKYARSCSANAHIPPSVDTETDMHVSSVHPEHNKHAVESDSLRGFES